MLSVMNQTWRFVNENLGDIIALQIEMQYFLNIAAEYYRNSTEIIKRVQILELSRMIDGLIGELEIIKEGYKAKRAIFHM